MQNIPKNFERYLIIPVNTSTLAPEKHPFLKVRKHQD